EIVNIPALNFPSGSDNGKTDMDNDGPSLSAITRLSFTIPPFSGVVPQLHDEIKIDPLILIFLYPSTSPLSTTPILNFCEPTPFGKLTEAGKNNAPAGDWLKLTVILSSPFTRVINPQ